METWFERKERLLSEPSRQKGTMWDSELRIPGTDSPLTDIYNHDREGAPLGFIEDPRDIPVDLSLSG
jgi:hypothetical protein